MEDQGKGAGQGPGRPADFVPLAEVRSSGSADPDLNAVRERLAGKQGRQYWRSLEELANTEEFQRYLEKEFPHQAPRDMAPVSRREFFRLMGATMALAGVGGCAYQPPEKIVPYVDQPEVLIPGKPLYYTTAFVRGGYAYGVLAESHMGRPIKLEGNDRHPASLGATDVYVQGSLLGLYDPDRSQAVRHFGGPSTWDAFQAVLQSLLPAFRGAGRRGAGLRILTGSFTSPTLAAQLQKLLKQLPQAKVHQHEPAGRDHARAGARQAFGQEVHPVYNFQEARRILSLDSDFLLEEPGSIRYAREFMDGRRTHDAPKAAVKHRTPEETNRLYVVESSPTLTGANADHRLTLRPSEIEHVARAVAAAVGASAPGGAPAGAPALPHGVPQEWISAVAQDLKEHRGAGLVVAGPYQSPAVHALAHAMNETLGNTGKTVTYIAPVEVTFGDPATSLQTLVADMNAGRVEALFILGCNPEYTAPADILFTGALQKFNDQPSGIDPQRKKLSVHLGLYEDETAIWCQWHLPQSHYLEAWSDARSFEGTASIIQPLITPLYATRSVHEVLSMIVDELPRPGYEIVREYWMGTNPSFRAPAGRRTGGGGVAGAGGGARPAAPGAGGGAVPGGGGITGGQAPVASPAFEKFWHRALTDGVVPNSRPAAKTVALSGGAGGRGPGAGTAPSPASGHGAGGAAAQPATGAGGAGWEIIFRPDPHIWDGSFANNAWLQELPKPLTLLTWDNAALISPAGAQQLGLVSDVHDYEGLSRANGQFVELSYRGHTLRVPVWVTPGHPDNAVTLHLGYGRSRAGKVGTGTGFNAYAIRTSDAPWSGAGLQVTKAAGHYSLASAQMHRTLEGRDLVRVGTVKAWHEEPDHPPFMAVGHHAEGLPPSLYPQEWPSDVEPEQKPGVWEHRDITTEDENRAPAYNNEPIPAWGMVIDLNTCIGCNACTIACQAENNVATVGKDEVLNNREMHWIRVDNYYAGAPENPEALFQPVPCMHCEKAPCEPVCPVEATSHSAEGINEMTYNRCIGTRYCSNNCPYKVRRFNYLQYSDQKTPTIQLMQNPDVTVRSRGVMEKCTYCIQRINHARIEAEKEGRPIRDGDVVVACAQACPTRAIIFGDANDRRSNNGKGSRVRQIKQNPLDYGLLTELNTRPRTTYLARLRNPNPALAPAAPPTGGGGHDAGGAH
jgi:MoCo/4Fe-4S cofactor protein with predicted Tat translocation signal